MQTDHMTLKIFWL